jgi:uncharacterized membrane protein
MSPRGLRLAVIAAGWLAGALAYPMLTLPVGDEARLIRPFMVFLLPAAAATIHVLLGQLWSRDRARDRDDTLQAVFDAIVLRCVLFVIAIHFTFLAVFAQVPGVRPWAGRIVIVLFGLTITSIGNLLPRTRPNVAIGFRTSRTMANRRLWMDTHRIAGYLTVALGIVIIISGVALKHSKVGQAIGFGGLLAVTTFAFTYQAYRRA